MFFRESSAGVAADRDFHSKVDGALSINQEIAAKGLAAYHRAP